MCRQSCSGFILILAIITIVSSCTPNRKEIDWESVPIMFDAEILDRDFPARVIELSPIHRIGSDGWNIDPEDPQYVEACGDGLVLFDRFSGCLYALDLESKEATELLTVSEGKEQYVIGIDASENGDVLVYTRDCFFRPDTAELQAKQVFAASAALYGDQIVVVNNLGMLTPEGHVLSLIGEDGSVLRSFGDLDFATKELGEKYNHHLRLHGNTAAVWNRDFPEVVMLDLDTGEQRQIVLEHATLKKRELINDNVYFNVKKIEGKTGFSSVFADMDFNDDGLFALMSNVDLGVVLHVSTTGAVKDVYTFPLKHPAVAFDIAVLKKEKELQFCIVIARGHKLSAYLYSAPNRND